MEKGDSPVDITDLPRGAAYHRVFPYQKKNQFLFFIRFFNDFNTQDKVPVGMQISSKILIRAQLSKKSYYLIV